MAGGKKRKKSGIRKRWMINSLSAVAATLVLAILVVALAEIGYCYSTLGATLSARVSYAVTFFQDLTESEYYQSANYYVNDVFQDSEHLELQFLDTNGTIRLTSYGLKAGSRPGTPDIQDALRTENEEPVSWTGPDPSTGERIIAVSCPIRYNGVTVGILREVSSLRPADRQIITVVGVATLIALAIMAMVYLSNLYFVRSIVDPVTEITETTRRIADGSYGVQIEKKFDDEIGDLSDAINDMSQQIKQSEKMKNEFISSVSHELRTPLTAINGWAETILNGEVREEADSRKGLNIIVSEARRLTNMVEELLEFSRIEDGRFTLSIEPVDIKAELEDAVYTYREFFRKEGIELRYTDCEQEFPPLPADPERLRQVFCNLLDNAGKHGGSGKYIDVSVSPDRENAGALIRIRDYGPGIPEDELPHVKTKFYKGSSKARGSGIGLAVCEEIVQRHNGTLEIGNAEGGGCLVTIFLPTGT